MDKIFMNENNGSDLPIASEVKELIAKYERIWEALESLLKYTRTFEILLQADESDQCKKAYAVLQEDSDD